MLRSDTATSGHGIRKRFSESNHEKGKHASPPVRFSSKDYERAAEIYRKDRESGKIPLTDRYKKELPGAGGSTPRHV